MIKINKLQKAAPDLPDTGVYKIVKQLDRIMRVAFLDALEKIKSEQSLKELAAAFESGGINAAIDAIGSFDPYFESTLVPALNDAVARSGRLAVTTTLEGAVPNTFAFNTLNPLTVQAVSDRGASLVREISQNTLDGIIEANRVGLIVDRSPVATARKFRDALGLTTSQAQAVSNYRNSLITGSREALKYELRDKRFDASARQIIDSGKADMVKIEKMVQRYEEKYIKYRSEVIGRTESMRAVSMGDYEAGRQAEDSGALDEEYRRFWVDTGDNRERASHFLIEDMNPQGRRFNDSFQTPLGPLMYPRDPSGTAANTIQCRCRTVLKRKASIFFNR